MLFHFIRQLASRMGSYESLHSLALASIALFTMFVAGCTDGSQESSGASDLSIIVAQLSSEGCEESPNGQSDFPPNVDRFIVDVSGSGGFTATISKDELDTAGRVFVPGVPPGEDLTLNLYGCSAENELTWSGRVHGLEVRPDDKVAPRLYFTRKNAMSCTGATDIGPGGTSDELEIPRLLHHSVSIGSDVFIFGGFNVYRPTDTPPSWEATANDIVKYDSTRGAFRVLDAALSKPRGMAHALVMGDQRYIAVVGGVTRAELQQSPPVQWTETALLPLPIELIDVQAEEVLTAKLSIDNVPYSAAAATSAGTEFVIAGGRGGDGQPVSSVTWITGNPDEILEGTALQESGNLTYERMGATAHFLPDDSGLVVIGGSINSSPGALAELVTSADNAVPIELVDSTPSPFALHASAHVASEGCSHVYAVVGGVDLNRADPNPPLFVSPSASTSRLALLSLDLCNPGAPLGRYQDQSVILDSTVRARRVFHRLDALDGGALLLSGGYNQIGQPTIPASADCEGTTVDTGCWLRDVTLLQGEGTLDALVMGEVSRGEMSVARFGHQTALLPDGSLLFTGGMRQISTDPKSIAAAAELYNPLLPSDSERCN